MRLGRLFATLLLLASVGACSFVVDASDIDERCGDNEKICDDRCVLISDPAYGCQIDGCTSCALGAHTIPKCVDYACTVRTCLEGFCGTTCDTDMLTDEDNCGACGLACDKTIGQTCQAGMCR
jgi:hypothetical protein